jgi:hypothetical protein
MTGIPEEFVLAVQLEDLAEADRFRDWAVASLGSSDRVSRSAPTWVNVASESLPELADLTAAALAEFRAERVSCDRTPAITVE